MATCFECLGDVPDGAQVCHSCGRRIVGRQCPQCAELSRAVARKCHHCGHSFARDDRISSLEDYSAEASFLATVLLRGRLIPQKINLSSEKIVIQTWGIFWLSRTDEDIPWEKIAGYHYHSGILWDRVEIQTRGQKSNVIGGLPKSSGKVIKEILELMKE